MATDQEVSSGISDAGLAALMARCRPGHSLPQPFYGDPAVFRRDVERIFMRHWLCVGHESVVRDPGDYFVYDFAGESVIVVRAEDGALRAHANVCRHRGSRVCRDSAGRAKVFICPYHAWAYNLDGSLRAARHMGEDFDRASHGLKPVHLRVIEGLVFISFADEPLALDEVERTLRQGFRPYGWAAAKIAHRQSYRIEANWKLAVENYVECYHCAPAHPEYSLLHSNEVPPEKRLVLDAAMDARAGALGIAIGNSDRWALAAGPGEEAIYCKRHALYDGMVSGTADGGPAALLMGAFRDYDGGHTIAHLGPASFYITYPDYGLIFLFRPLSASASAMEVIWLVRSDAVEGRDYDLGRLTWLWEVTSLADKQIIEGNQQGVNSRYYEPGPYAPMEPNARRLTEWYLAELA